MPSRASRFCAYAGCVRITTGGRYCPEHQAIHKKEEAEKMRERDKKRGNAYQRGYNYKWSKYSKWFLSQPQNQFCVLHLDDQCTTIANCVDHIKPHRGQKDPLFWDKGNHQPACIHCNSVKGNRETVGTFTFGSSCQSEQAVKGDT